MALSFDKDALKAAFDKNAGDRGNADTCDLVEFGAMLVELTGKHDWDVTAVEKMFDGVSGSDAQLTFEELWTGINKKPATKNQLEELFDQYDKDGSGFLSKDELMAALNTQANVTEEKAQEILEAADTSDDGKISKAEFVKSCS